MSKQTKRKITVELPKKDLVRPSVFERLGTKKASSKKSEHCRQWAQNGNCAYGKSCKFASTHTLVSPSKRVAIKDSDLKRLLKDDPKSRLHSTVVIRSDRSPGEIDNWDQNDLEYADTDVLEKRRQQLQRELDLQLKMDGKDKKKKDASSSSSSRSSSSSSMSSSTSDGSSSSTSSDRNPRKKEKKTKLKRNCSSSSDGEVPSKKKYTKDDTSKRDKSENKKSTNKKDDRLVKKPIIVKKKTAKSTLSRKSFSPGRKTGGTPPIQLKALSKVYGSSKRGRSPQRRDRNKSVSPSPNKDRDRDRGKEREKERDRARDRDRNRGRSRSTRVRSRSIRPRRSHSKDVRRKDSSERIRPISPKKQVRRETSLDRHRKTSESKDRDRNKDQKDKSLERRKDKHEEKDRHDRKDKIDRSRDRTKDVKKEDSSKRNKVGRERGSRGAKEPDKGLAKPNKPMERLLPRPEERLAALAAITNKVLDVDNASTTSKDRQDSERGNRKQDRERGNKRGERISSLDRDPGDYDNERQYDRSRPLEDYNRAEDGYSDGPREDDRSPGYSRDRRYDPSYDLAGPPRSYPEGDDRMYMGDHRGYDERRRDRSWEGRPGSMDRERPYMHPRKEWEGEEYRPDGNWGRERHWPMHEPPMGDWGDKDPDIEGWHHRGPGPHGRSRGPDDYGRNMRKERVDKRRAPPRPEPETVAEAPPPVAAPPARTDAEEEKPIPDDLSEISDDPDDILNREDMVEQPVDEDSQTSQVLPEDTTFKPDTSENQSTQDTSAAGDDKESQEGKDDEVVSNLDFEEISDGELEEERTRAGLGDALGVDWASLVADVQRRDVQAPIGSALSRWNPQRVLAKLGLSVEMAGAETVQEILDANTEQQRSEENTNEEEKVQSVNVKDVHPVAAIQVAIQKRALERAALFGSGCEIRRALSGRRDLAVRRHLCRLPGAERAAPPRRAPHRDLFHAARALLMQQPLPA